MDFVKFGQTIREYRLAKHWSQAQLAERVGVSTSFIGHIERGSRTLSVETLVKLCVALEADPAVLLPISRSSQTIGLTHEQKDQLLSLFQNAMNRI